MAHKLKKKIKYSGTIEILTGLHIGGSKESMEIGGVDNSVIRDPLTQQPFIPGSSLKGKIRSLLQLTYGELKFKDTGSDLCKLFGSIEDKDKNTGGNPSRLIFRDSHMTPESAKELGESEFTDLPYTEIKTENTIDRITGKSSSGLRQQERVPKGAKFNYHVVLNVFEEDDESKLRSIFEQGLKLLEDDYLGGSGSRGYGQIKLHRNDPIETAVEDYK